MTKPRKHALNSRFALSFYAAKLEGMTNFQIPNDCDLPFLSFGLCASFVIRHSCFVICAWLS
ncbi:MAG: hypothetical protein DMF31_03135 [Verrucomicrobia bacterium]|nr:MAG: hypothetical protein DMF31_03135 [Verrucomicrobiota bacterium]